MIDISEVSKAAAPLMENFAKLTGPLCEEVGLYFGDKARAFRERNASKVIEGSIKLLVDAGKPINPVPPRLLLPILESASVEDNPTLQDMWAGLLASASDQADAMSPSFVETLKAMTPSEARIFKLLFEGKYEDLPVLGVSLDVIEPLKKLRSEAEEDRGEIQYGIESLERLGLLERSYAFKRDFKTAMTQTVMLHEDSPPVESVTFPRLNFTLMLTLYAVRFMQACRGPQPLSSSALPA